MTNAPLTALGTPGFFDREFAKTRRMCAPARTPTSSSAVSASPVTAEVPVSAARIGDEFALTGGPGEIFSNLSNTLKESRARRSPCRSGRPTTPSATCHSRSSSTRSASRDPGSSGEFQGYAFVNYEDSYAIDKCFGDMALETSIGLLDGLR